MKSSEALDKIAPALVAALAELRGVAKDAKNPHFKNDYATLENVIDTARPVLASHKLGAMQGLGEYVNGAITVTTRIIHESGQWIESDFQIPAAKADPQSAGSAVTYGRRYSLMGILGLPAVDDDGQAATTAAYRPAEPARKTPAQAKRDGDDARIKAAIQACTDLEQLGAYGARQLLEERARMPPQWQDAIDDMYLLRREELLGRDFRQPADSGLPGGNGHMAAEAVQ